MLRKMVYNYIMQIQRLCTITILLFMPVFAYADMSGDIATFSRWMANLQTQLPYVLKLIVAVSYVVGTWFVVLAIMKLKQYGSMTIFSSSQTSIVGPMTYLLVGIALFYFPSLVNVSIYTFWGYGTDKVLQYPAGGEFDWHGLLNPVIAVVRIIGYVSFLRGWIMISRLGHHGGSQPGTFSKAAIHIIGGLLAINIVGTWDVISNSINYAVS